MTDRQGDSSQSAPGAGKKPADQKPAGAAAQAQPADGPKHYTIPRRTPERPSAQEESDGARASRSRDEKSTDKQTAGQQQRSGAHPPQRLAAALAQAADPVQGSIDQAQQSVSIACAMQHAAVIPSLLSHQQQVFHPPAGGLPQQYPPQSILNALLARHQQPTSHQPQAHPLASEVTHLRVAFLLSRRVPAPRPPSPPPHSRGAVVAGMTNSSKTQLWQTRRGSSLTITRISWTRLPSQRTRKVARASREQRCSSLRRLPRA